jgi:serine/threonine protein kinase
MLSDLKAIELVLSKAVAPEDVFGPLEGSTTERQHHLQAAWRKLTQVTHPDKYTGDPTAAAIAKTVFISLNEWRTSAEAKITSGTYGNGKPHVEPPKPLSHDPVTVTVSKRSYVVTSPIFTGDIATLYGCSYSEVGKDHHRVFKVARSAADNDLMEAEQRALAKLWAGGAENVGDRRLLPRFTDSFVLRNSGPARRVNVLSRHDDYYSLAEVMHVYPNGIDFRDAVWMFKRGLAVLGFVHQQGLIHGAILPAHILIHPVHHGAKLVDWCYSVSGKGHVRAVVTSHKSYYPQEVLSKKPVSPATDIYMLAKCITQLLDKNAPKQVQSFLQGCTLAAQAKRPDDAWGVHQEFKELIERLIGPAKYRPFTMPARA